MTRSTADNSVSGVIEYLDVGFAGTCPSAAALLTIATRLFTEIDPDHRMFTQLLRPPPDVINALIALSIAITASDNIHPFIPVPRAAVAAFFGIIHGFGFATALGALQLTGGSFVLALVGFNLGIEAAQIGLVLIVMPALAGGRWMLWFGSALAGSVALWWFWLRLTPFFPA